MPIVAIKSQKLTGYLLCAIGSLVIAGWMLGNKTMVTVVPGSVAMSINTALMFLASGLSLICLHRDTGNALVRTICPPFLVILSTLILFEHVTDINLWIDLTSVHAALGDGHSRPGRTAPNACIGFLLTGLVFMARTRHSIRDRMEQASIALVVAVLVIGWSALLGYFLNLHAMYQLATYNRMAALTAVGFCILGTGLWMFHRNTRVRPASNITNQDKRVTAMAAALLTVFAIAAGLSGFWVLREGFEKNAADNIRNTARNNSYIISDELNQSTLLAKSVAMIPVLPEHLRDLDVNPNDADSLRAITEIAQSYLSLGAQGIRFDDRQGKTLATAGRLTAESSAVSVPLSLIHGKGELFWNDGFFLRAENPVVDGFRVVGRVVMERQLHSLTTLIEESQRAGTSTDLLLCGREANEALCFPTRFYAAGKRIPLFGTDGSRGQPIVRALRGEIGAATVTDFRGIAVLAGHAPLDPYGLGLVHTIDVDELYAPMRDKLNLLVVLLLMFVAAGTILVRKLLQPLVTGIVAEQQRMAVILKNSNDAFIAVGQDGRVTDWNEQAAATFGWTADEAIGSDLATLIIPKGQRPSHNANFNEFVRAGRIESDKAAGKRQALNRRLEMIGLHRSGKEIPLEVSLAAFHDGRRFVITAFLRDITERKAAERQAAEHARSMEEARVALIQSQKLEAIGKLTGGVAHDFNNVLQVVMGSLQLLQAEMRGNDRAAARVEAAIDAVRRGAKLSTELLAFARKQPLQPVPTNLARVVRGMHEMLQRALGGTTDIETIAAAGLWNALIDPNQLEHVILNLAINARDAMQGQGKLTIEIGNASLDDDYVRAEPGLAAGQYVMLAMSDTGSGMTAETIERAFEPFFTTKPEGQGTGLGLSMAYGFVKQSGGHIRIYSEVGEGTTIKLYFPRSFEPESVPVTNINGPVTGGSETILVVEDDPAVQSTVVAMLGNLGYRVLKADHGEQALEILRQHGAVDLLFTDVVMPGSLRSPDLARQAKLLFPNIKVLFTSGYTQNAIVHSGRLDPGVHLLSKPYQREQLARKIRDLLDATASRFLNHAAAATKDVPGLQPAEQAERQPAARHGDEPPSTGGDGLDILVVEDNEDFRYLVGEMLAMLGHRAHHAASGEAALEQLEQRSFDVLLSDIGLPGMSGVDLANIAVRRADGMKVIFASGFGGLPGNSLPDYDFIMLSKPYSMTKLRDAIDGCTAGTDQEQPYK
ncbi:MAG TPA: response regulator [Noviherbaspirillum sp.]|jgi:PAS domain S-box-containing protein|uniref:response regulator n=1 Tax=Noviherbaspirillum sp. TaxID=1926288 RepID=UPI002DDD4C90|nr:response regulator [Noviherbaspirillum sp.]HEV2612564.1 response regulator [Noviherbaspirillum sp.]